MRFILLAFMLIGCVHSPPVKMASNYGMCDGRQFVTTGNYLPLDFEYAVKDAIAFWNVALGYDALFYEPDLPAEKKSSWISINAVDKYEFALNTRGHAHSYRNVQRKCVSGSHIIVRDDEQNYPIIVAHELGHALGLGHSGEWNSLMYWEYSVRTEMKLGADSVAELEQSYGVN